MYKANLSFTQLSAYLNFMIKNSLIEQKMIEDKEIYEITLKGSDFLQIHNELIELLRTGTFAKKVKNQSQVQI
jgi:predicted transcriptional regulator